MTKRKKFEPTLLDKLIAGGRPQLQSYQPVIYTQFHQLDRKSLPWLDECRIICPMPVTWVEARVGDEGYVAGFVDETEIKGCTLFCLYLWPFNEDRIHLPEMLVKRDENDRPESFFYRDEQDDITDKMDLGLAQYIFRPLFAALDYMSKHPPVPYRPSGPVADRRERIWGAPAVIRRDVEIPESRIEGRSNQGLWFQKFHWRRAHLWRDKRREGYWAGDIKLGVILKNYHLALAAGEIA